MPTVKGGPLPMFGHWALGIRHWALGIVLLAGCEKDRPYTPRPAPPAEAAKKGKDRPPEPAPLDESLHWMEPGRPGEGSRDVRIEFVHAGTQPEEWARLRRCWTDPLPWRGGAGPG